MATKSRYDEMSLEHLERLQEDHMAKRDVLKAEMTEVKAAMDQKAALRKAEETLVGFSPDQVDAIAKVARAQSQAAAREA